MAWAISLNKFLNWDLERLEFFLFSHSVRIHKFERIFMFVELTMRREILEMDQKMHKPKKKKAKD